MQKEYVPPIIGCRVLDNRSNLQLCCSNLLYFHWNIFFLFTENFICFWLCWIFVAARGLSLVALSGVFSLAVVLGLLIAVASLTEHRLEGAQARQLPLSGSRVQASVVLAHGLSCPEACGILPEQGCNPCPLHWQADSQPLDLQEVQNTFFLIHQSTEGNMLTFPTIVVINFSWEFWQFIYLELCY